LLGGRFSTIFTSARHRAVRSQVRELIRAGLTTRALSRKIGVDPKMANDGESCTGILVVDDDPDIRDSLREVLEDEGYTVNTVANGREALDYLHRSPRPCVILLDLMMPVMDGWQFRREQKQDPAIAAIPLIVITATGKRPVLIDADELVMKPLDLGRLFEAIERYC
jgi:CheY-like chemotaxis protein